MTHTNTPPQTHAAGSVASGPAESDLLTELEQRVRDYFGPRAQVDRLERLRGGASLELWSFDVVGPTRDDAVPHELVLRCDPPGFADPAARRREFEVMSTARSHRVPLPVPMWFQSSPRAGLVMERVHGEAIPRRILRDDRYAIARDGLTTELARAAAAIHRSPVDEHPTLARPTESAAATALKLLERQLDAMQEPHPVLELGLRWLWRHLPEPTEPTLVHGDFRLGNVMVNEGGLVAVLDWEFTHIGDPAEDLGWLCIRSWRFGEDQLPAAGLGTREELIDAYAGASGRRITSERLNFWEVHGNVRWAAIAVQQAAGHLTGKRRSLEHAVIGRRTCEPEWDLLRMIG